MNGKRNLYDMKILIIVPAYNEEKSIESVIEDVKSNCPEGDILVINDCSWDKTPQILDRCNTKCINLSVNLGIGGAVQTGYLYALRNQYDIAVQFDGDGQHKAEYIKKLIEPIIDASADIVIGSRFIEKRGFQSSAVRRTGISFLSAVIRWLSGVDVKDVTSGMRAVNRKMIELYACDYAQDFPEPEAILSAGLHNAKIIEVPVEMRGRISGKSSISTLKSVYYMIKVSLALILSRMSMEKKVK